MWKMGFKKIIDTLYCFIFSRKFFYPLHKLLLQLSVKGMGININWGLSKTGEVPLLSSLSKKLNTEESIIFDVGASIGGYSKLLTKYFPKAKIYAFEPVSANIEAFQKVHGSNKNIKLIQKGLGDTNSKKIIRFPKCNGTSALPSLHDVFKNNEDLQEEEINVIKLDDFCKKEHIDKIDFIKLDIEGNEFSALKGAKKLIKQGKIKIIQFEFNFLNVYSRIFMEDFKELLEGYDLYRILPHGLLRIDFSRKIYSEIFSYQNILAINKNEKK